MKASVLVRGLSVKYDDSDRPTLDGLDMDVAGGEHVGLIGRSGSGKSTLMNVLCGLIPDRFHARMEGTVEVCGVTVPGRRKELAERVGAVFQAPEEMFVSEMALDELAFSLGCRGTVWEEARERCVRTAVDLGMEGSLTNRTRDLSGGEKQLLAIASQVVTSPDLLILDEPSSQLDPSGRGRLLRSIRKLRSDRPGMSVLQIEQDLDMLADADRVLVLDRGRIVRAGPPEQVLMDRESLWTEGLRPPPLLEVVSMVVEMGKANRPLSLRKGLPSLVWSALSTSSPLPSFCPKWENRPAQKTVLKGVRFRHPGARRGLKGVDMDLTGLSSVALIGRNGAGKTTLGRIIAGSLRPDSGAVQIDGERFYLFQRPSLMFFSDTVSSELGGSKNAGMLMLALGLDRLAEKDPSLLSEGEKQRLGIALALCSGTDLLVLDEPFKALDRPLEEKVWDLMRGKGSPAHLIITNDLATASRCQQVVVLDHGRIIAQGPPDGVLCDPSVMGRLGWTVPPACPISRRSGMAPTSDIVRIVRAMGETGI